MLSDFTSIPLYREPMQEHENHSLLYLNAVYLNFLILIL